MTYNITAINNKNIIYHFWLLTFSFFVFLYIVNVNKEEDCSFNKMRL